MIVNSRVSAVGSDVKVNGRSWPGVYVKPAGFSTV